jgi:hypothetical protein
MGKWITKTQRMGTSCVYVALKAGSADDFAVYDKVIIIAVTLSFVVLLYF